MDNPPHLVISDADFPGLDACEMARVLQDTHGDTIPLLAVHSEDTEGDQIAFTWSGLADRPDGLRAIVRSRPAVGDQGATGAPVLVVDVDPNIRFASGEASRDGGALSNLAGWQRGIRNARGRG